MSQIFLYALEIFACVQHADSEGVAHIVKTVFFDLAFFQNSLEVLIHGPSHQVLPGFICENQIPFVLPGIPKSCFVTTLLLLLFPKRIKETLAKCLNECLA
jgi:hypothetical protein